MTNKKIISALMLMLTAFIWGVAFVAQSVGMDYVGPLTFNCIRFIIGGIVLIPCIYILKKIKKEDQENNYDKKMLLKGGISCGIVLFIASTLQQFGIMYTSVGKAGFITALYIIIVPIIEAIFKKRTGKNIWLSVGLAVIGMYLLCIKEGFSIQYGDILELLCALFFSIHILVIDYFADKADGVKMSCIQFFSAGLLSMAGMFIFEDVNINMVFQAWMPICYAGIMSCGVAYTLQIIGQQGTNPVVSALILSLESVFSVLAAWILLGQQLSEREAIGCILVFLGIIIAQLPQKKADNKG